MTELKNLTWHETTLTKAERQQLRGHKSCVIWFTGLSASGKSSIANALEKELFERNISSYVLDGDNIRHGLNNNLGFSPEDRKENIRRIGEVAKLFVDAGVVALTAFISPYKADRDTARQLVGENEFIEVFVKCPVEICETRDPKGLYQKARAGVIPEFTGVSAPYEEPEKAEIILNTDQLSIQQSVDTIINYLIKKGIINA
jgi:adenylylsulfate kinase